MAGIVKRQVAGGRAKSQRGTEEPPLAKWTLIGIAMDDDTAVVEPFVREHGMPYVNLIGNEDVAGRYGPLRGLPTKFLVDREGKIVDTFFGPVPRSVLEKKIEALL